MDVDLARTFLAVVETGSFLAAADRVFVTQSTVSARIRTLEERLGRTLFARSKAGASLTPAGVQFQKHAQAMVRLWEHARLEISLPEGYQVALSVGGQYSLWDGYLLQWLGAMRANTPDIAIRAQMGFSDVLMQGLINGTLDLGIMYTPQERPGFEVERLFEDQIVLVSSTRDSSEVPAKGYVFIDWGPEFRADHALNFPSIDAPGTYLELGSLSLSYLIQTGASGYVPRRLVRDYLQAGTLCEIGRAPVFSYPAYAVYPSEAEDALMAVILEELRRAARQVAAR